MSVNSSTSFDCTPPLSDEEMDNYFTPPSSSDEEMVSSEEEWHNGKLVKWLYKPVPKYDDTKNNESNEFLQWLKQEGEFPNYSGDVQKTLDVFDGLARITDHCHFARSYVTDLADDVETFIKDNKLSQEQLTRVKNICDRKLVVRDRKRIKELRDKSVLHSIAVEYNIDLSSIFA